MTNWEIVLLAFALSVDACVVSFYYGITFNKNRIKNCLLISFITGFFQAIMPCLGYHLVSLVKQYLEPIAPILVCVIFVFLGINVIKETLKEEQHMPNCIGLLCLLLIGFATSVDAFSAGVTLSLSNTKLLMPVILFGVITFINSVISFSLAGKIQNVPKKKMEIFAGIVLILLGILTLF